MSNVEAEWRPNPAWEREIIAASQAMTYRKTSRRLFTGSAVFMFAWCGFSIAEMDSVSVITFTSCLVCLASAIYASCLAAKRQAIGRRRESALYEEYSSLSGWHVDLFVLQGDAPTGRDRGVIWFEEDRLYFVGDRTSFGISRGQVKAMLGEEWSVANLRPQFVLQLHADTPAGKAAVGMNMIRPLGSTLPNPSSNSLSQALRGWIRSTGGDDGQLPPLTLGPEAPTRSRLLKSALGTTFLWSAMVPVLGFIGWIGGWVGLSISFAVGSLLMVSWGDHWFPRLRWRAWRHRKCLDEAGHNRTQ